MEKVIHRAATRGVADNGWEKTWYTFSYNTYYDPRRIHFGALRVLNENLVDGGEGSKSHHHDNMEIITLVLDGAIEHGDNLGNVTVIPAGGVQAMTAGTGLVHNEYNKSQTEPVRFLQIWLYPRDYEIPPCYSYAVPGFPDEGQVRTIVASDKDGDAADAARITQDAWIYMAGIGSGSSVTHTVHTAKHGTYIFVIEGAVTVCGIDLGERDGLGIWDVAEFDITASAASRVLLIEVPMHGD